ncbi:hypothetical protein ACFVFS_17390 [Kitasatospora sp. NPDC057692]|uniref:hypothetical protein n=1 Tax=Kitasatospora sp. NPDC057692 TaxID=3346215 RepID=UPI003693AA02
MTDRDTLVDAAAAALLLASITMRDLASAMAPAVYAAMPSDLKNRVMRPIYQDAFDALPADVKHDATALVNADPDIITARHVDAR